MWALILVVLASWMFQTWERWNQPSKGEVALVFVGLALWGWAFWTVVNAL